MNQKPLFLNKDQACFLLIDLQQRFIPAMEQSEYELIRKNIIILSQAAKILNIPLLYTQQYTKGLGNTDPLILSHIDGEHIEKNCFSCYGEDCFIESIEKTGRKQILIAGIETHICVLQTALDLLEKGYDVMVLEDAVMSRTSRNKKTALDYLAQSGAWIGCLELALFQILKKSGSPEFKEISSLIK